MNHYINNLMPISADMLLVGGRGFGKNAAAAHWRRQMAAVEAMYPSIVPAQVVGNLDVRWACKRPTEPVYHPSQAGWWEERTSAYMRGEADMLDIIIEAKNAARDGSWVI